MSSSRVRRRDFVAALLGAPALTSLALSSLAACVDDRVPDGELIDPGMNLGHRLRELHRAGPFVPPTVAQDAPIFDVIVVGGGVAGLAAVRRLRAAGLTRVQLIELDDRLGGTARSGESPVTRFPWGAHYVTAPLREDTLTIGVLDELGAIEGRDALGHPIIAERFACREPDERLLVDGLFHEGLTPQAALDAHDEHDLRRFEDLVDGYAALVDGAGAPAFALPRARSSRDAAVLSLDRLSFRDWLLSQGLTSPHLHWLCDYAVRDDDGVDLDEASAWAGLFYFCARRRPGVEERAVVTWPEGNGALVSALARHLPLPPLVDHAVVDVRATDGGALVTVLDGAGTLRGLLARHVVVATPRFVAARLVEPLRRAPPAWLSSFSTSAWVTANVHLRERPKDKGLPFAWDTVALDGATPYGASLGYVNATHQRGVDHGPTVWTWYLPLTGRPPEEARRLLHDGDRALWASVCVNDLEHLHPGVRRLITRVDVGRFGHAMVRPVPGLFSSGDLDAAAAPVGPIHFAHTDLSGMALFEEALFHGTRAAEEILAARGLVTPSWLPT
jgi:hypothetical protein